MQIPQEPVASDMLLVKQAEIVLSNAKETLDTDEANMVRLVKKKSWLDFKSLLPDA